MAEEDKKEEKKEEEKPVESTQAEKSQAEEKTEEPVKEEVKVEEVKPEGKPKDLPAGKAGKPAPTGKFKDLIKEIEGLSVADLAELVKALEERFGVSAAAPHVVAAASNGAPAGGAAPVEEKTNYTVVLVASGEQKINVIKAIREINQNLGLKEAKDLADNPPKEIKKDVPKAEAEEAKKKLEAVGAKVELK